jgi:hypothetical protein
LYFCTASTAVFVLLYSFSSSICTFVQLLQQYLYFCTASPAVFVLLYSFYSSICTFVQLLQQYLYFCTASPAVFVLLYSFSSSICTLAQLLQQYLYVCTGSPAVFILLHSFSSSICTFVQIVHILLGEALGICATAEQTPGCFVLRQYVHFCTLVKQVNRTSFKQTLGISCPQFPCFASTSVSLLVQNLQSYLLLEGSNELLGNAYSLLPQLQRLERRAHFLGDLAGSTRQYLYFCAGKSK